MFGVQCAAKAVDAVFLSMPLLTELGWSEDGLCYRRGATNGALPPGQQPIPPKIAKNPPPLHKGLSEKDLLPVASRFHRRRHWCLYFYMRIPGGKSMDEFHKSFPPFGQSLAQPEELL